jgi:hypothetical protein
MTEKMRAQQDVEKPPTDIEIMVLIVTPLSLMLGPMRLRIR